MSDLYFDVMAATQLDPRVCEAMSEVMQNTKYCANPSAVTHAMGQNVKERIQKATEDAAQALNCLKGDLTWTSGATESIHLAIHSVAKAYCRHGKHIVSMASEHKASLAVFDRLRSEGFEISLLSPKSSGVVDLSELKKAIRPDTILLSVMSVNNETGVIQPISELASIAKEEGILLHTDAAQALGKIPLDLKELGADLVSLSPHKCYGPKGIGLLYAREKLALHPLIDGGGQQPLRSGTLPTHQIVGASKAIILAQEEQAKDAEHARACQSIIVEGLSKISGVHFHINPKNAVPNCISLHVEGVDISALLALCFDIAMATGSACNAATKLPSHVLLSMGIDSHVAHHSLRISYGRFTTKADCHALVSCLSEAVNCLRYWAGLSDSTSLRRSLPDKNTQYSEKVWGLFKEISHLGAASGLDCSIEECTEDKRLKVAISVADGVIARCRAEVLGTPVLIALAEFLCQSLEGLDPSKVALDWGLISAELGLDDSNAHIVHLARKVASNLLKNIL